MAMQMELSQRSVIDSAVRHLVTNHSPQGNRIGWLMMASILVEAWDLYGIAFVLIFIRDQYHPIRCCSGSPPREPRAARSLARFSAAGCRTSSAAG